MTPFFIVAEGDDGEKLNIVERVFRKFEKIGDVKIPRKYWYSDFGGGDFGSVKWYVERAYHPERGQVSTQDLWELFEKEPWQKTEPHYEFMILKGDLFARDTSFVFGETKRKISGDGTVLPDDSVRGTIISTYRPKKLYGSNWGDALYYLIMHELGHFYGLPSHSNPDFIKVWDRRYNPLEWGHCDDRECVMEQVNVSKRPDLLEKALYLKAKDNWFCRHDREALRKNLKRMYG